MIIQTTSQMKLKSIFGALVLLSAVPAFGENAPASFEEKMVRAEQLISSDSSQAIAIFTEMAEMYTEGKGVPMDSAKAFEWYKKVADSEAYQPDDVLYVGQAYLNGTGVEKNLQQAVSYLTKSANHGDSEANRILGKLYEEGSELKKGAA